MNSRVSAVFVLLVAAQLVFSQAAPNPPSKLRVSGSGTGGTGSPAGYTKTVSQFGITWSFDKDYAFGTFANGDFWVVGPVKVVSISPGVSNSGGYTLNGSMLNPIAGASSQGYDSRKDTYHASLNVGIGVSSSTPLIVGPGSSLISTISFTPTFPDQAVIKSAAILTVLPSPPANGSFRPGYCDATKAVKHNLSSMQYGLLRSVAKVASAPSLSVVERKFERPWIDHMPGWIARFFHPDENMPEYGLDLATDISIGALMLQLNYTAAEKETLAIRYVQLGIDLYSIAANGGSGNWEPDGGHASGRKWPILFAGLMLNSAAMKSIGPGDGTGVAFFGEDAQTFFVTQADIDRTGKQSWTVSYTAADLGLAEYGIRHATYPTWDTRAWLDEYNYRGLTGPSWNGVVLAARMMNARTLWQHDALFGYVDRYMQVTAPAGEHPGTRSSSKFTEDMWDAYRSLY